ncbi:MAG TPA: hypothetical protein PKD59_17500 [Miltoncostaeaceae bacterium]|nr:hypothetical protein [Miltoncostaeaceae bacterium]
MAATSTTYWVHPHDHVRRRRWTWPTGPHPAVALHATPRFA